MARFDLYNHRKAWWWYYYLSLAAAKNTSNYSLLVELIFEAIDYEDNYGVVNRKDLLSKYNVKNGTY